MRAVRYSGFGGPEVLRVEQVDEPTAGPGRIRITVRAAGVNGADWKMRQGLFAGGRPLAGPAGSGLDASGVVDQVGDGVTGVRPGDAVLGSGRATYAESAVLTAWAPLPAGVSFEEGAGWPVPVETAVRMLDAVGARPGWTVVVSGAAGGVGSALVQLAVGRGLRVIGTASAGNRGHLLALGAEPLTYDEGWADRARGLATDGIDAGFDVAGAGVLPDLIRLAGDPARVVSIADFSAPKLGALVTTGGGDLRAALLEATALHDRGAFTLPVERVLPLDRAGEAQEASRAGHARGRTVLVP